MLQDRNIHRDAQALRKAITIPLSVPLVGVDQDEPIYATIPRYNWRLSDLAAYANVLATADLIVKAQAVPFGAAVGSPQLGVLASPNFSVEEMWKNAQTGGFLTNKAAVASAPFDSTGIATVLDGFWGVWLLQINQSLDLQIYRQAPIMAFATEELALAACPQVFDDGANDARAAILTVNAVGGDFISGTTNTNAALVAAFNTAPQDGHVLTLQTTTQGQTVAATLGQQLKDASRTNILQGPGGPDSDGTMLVVTVRSAGVPVLTGPAHVVVDYRPWPAGGEGVGDASVSQNRPSFIP